MSRSKRNNDRRFHKYMFAEIKPSGRGIFSIVLGGISIALVIIGVIMSFIYNGDAGYRVGSLAFTSLILSGFGIFFGFWGFYEDEHSYTVCRIGIIMCGCICTFIIGLFFIGL